MLTLADLSAIELAIWSHPSGMSYLAKIEQLRVQSEACGNPCCAAITDWLIRTRRRMRR